MISFIKSWCEGIVVAVIISIIIEMIVPEGNNKKYIKVVIGIFIIFVTLNPILENLDIEYDFSNIFESDEYVSTSINLNNNIKDVYIDGISASIMDFLNEEGYVAKDVKVVTDKNYENLEKIEIYLSSSTGKKSNYNNVTIKPIVIGENIKEETENEEIRKIISEKYLLDLEKIYIFEN